MRIRYSSCPAETWESALTLPHPRLRPGVLAYRGIRMDQGLTQPWQGFPGGAVTLLLGLDAEQQLLRRGLTDRVGGTPLTSYVSGPTTRSSWIVEPSGGAHCVIVVLAPWAAFAIFGVDMYELAGAMVKPEDLLGDRVHQLAAALAALPGWEQRFRLLDDVLSMWLARGGAWSPRVQWAHTEVIRTGGGIPIAKLAEEAGWSPRQLEYRFQEQIGLSPKALARVVRFRRAALLLMEDLAPALVAGACGFSDQAHLTREFKAITGLTPDRFRVNARTAAATSAAHEVSHAAARHTGTPTLPAA